jgi:hypothetical protein
MASSVIQEDGSILNTSVLTETTKLPADSVCGQLQAAQDLLAAQEVQTLVEGE